MSRKQLRPILQRWPRWLLLIAFVILGLPIHIVVGLYAGLCSGIDDFRYEWKALKRLR